LDYQENTMGKNEAATEESEAKRKVERKPFWVCVPTAFEEIAEEDEEGNMISSTVPTAYSVTRCEGKKKSVESLLAHYDFDVANIESVLVFRGDPLPMKAQRQIIIRW